MTGQQQAWLAPIEGPNSRAKSRYVLRLPAEASLDDGTYVSATVLNMSQTGLLLQTAAELSSGDVLDVDLGDGTQRAAQVIWSDDSLVGCRFTASISSAGLSTARLRSPSTDAPGYAQDARGADTTEKLPRYQRGLLIIGLALASWLIVVAAIMAFRS
jgi:hypothetical protein